MARARVIVAGGVGLALTGCFVDPGPGACADPACGAGPDPGTATSTTTTGDEPTDTAATSTGTTGTTGTTGPATTGEDATTGPLPGVPVAGPAFRVDKLALADPRLYYSPLACVDGTDVVNDSIAAAIDARTTNILLVARDYDPDADLQEFSLYTAADCPPDADHCLLTPDLAPTSLVSVNKDAGNCLDLELANVNPANIDALHVPVAPCVSGPPATFKLALTPELSPIPVVRGRFAAQYAPDDLAPERLDNAILYGFVPRAEAEATKFMFMATPVSLWSLIRGSDHPDACEPPMGQPPDVDELDLDGDGMTPPTPGVYLHLNFSARRIDLYAPS